MTLSDRELYEFAPDDRCPMCNREYCRCTEEEIARYWDDLDYEQQCEGDGR